MFSTTFLEGLYDNVTGYGGSLTFSTLALRASTCQSKSLYVYLQNDQDFLEAITKGAIAVVVNKKMNLPSFVPTLFPVFYVEDTVQFIRQFLAKLKEEDTTKWEKILEMIEKELTSPFPINTSFLVKLKSYEKSMKNDVQVGGEEK